jgi:hypothetical protein
VEAPPLTWSYIGQTVHSYDAKPSTEETYVVTEDVEFDRASALLGTRKYDSLGSTWQVVAVDEAELLAVPEEEPRNLVELQDQDADSAEFVTDSPIEQPGMAVTWIPYSWTRGDCDGVGIFATEGDNHYWQGDDDRYAVDPDVNVRRQSIVEVRVEGETSTTTTTYLTRRKFPSGVGTMSTQRPVTPSIHSS